MKIFLNDFDKIRIEKIGQSLKKSVEWQKTFDEFVSKFANFVDITVLKSILDEYEMEPALGFAMLVSQLCQMDIFNKNDDKTEFNDFIVPTIKLLNVNDINDDNFIKKFSNSTIEKRTIKAGEAFFCDEVVVTSDFRQFLPIGFAMEDFMVPTLKIADTTFAVDALKIKAMTSHIENANGNVVVFGVGMGYFVYMIAGKKSVKNIKIIETNKELIDFFSDNILNNIENSGKICLSEQMELTSKPEDVDFIFVQSHFLNQNPLNQYLKIRRDLLEQFPNTQIEFYNEKTLLGELRPIIFNQMYKIMQVSAYPVAMDEIVINNYQEFVNMLSDSELRKLRIRS